MRLTLVTAPSIQPITLDEAKAWLRVTHDDENALITQLIAVARQALDGRDGFLGRALVTQTWKLALDRFPSAIEIPLPPLISIDAVDYVDTNGEAQAVDLETLTIEGIGDAAPAILRPVAGTSWPATDDRPDAVAITFTAGYGAAAADVPAPIRQAILMDVAHRYENREAAAVPDGYHDLLNDFRLWSF